MCKYISASHIQPGYICCQCKGYNGLQRVETVNGKVVTLCKFSNIKHHHRNPGCELLDLPEGLVQCANCFAGYATNTDGTPQIPVMNMAGKRFNELFCYICNTLFVKRTPETDKTFKSL